MVLPFLVAATCGDDERASTDAASPHSRPTIVDCDGRRVHGSPWMRAFREDGGYARLADLVPGFGGAFVDGDSLSVWLLDPDERDRAEPILRRHLSRIHPTFAGREIRWLEGDYDWRQLVVWKSCLSRRISWGELLTSAGIDERRNRVSLGARDDEARARLEREIARTAVPSEAVTVFRRGVVCTSGAIPSIVVQVRDASGHPAAIGSTVTIEKTDLEATGRGLNDLLSIYVWANNAGGTFRVRVVKPWHETAVFPEVRVPAGECGVTETVELEATIPLLSDAPPVRQILLPERRLQMPLRFCGRKHDVEARVLGDPGIPRGVVWVSRDSSVATVEFGEPSVDGPGAGGVTLACREDRASTYVVAMAAADTTVRDSVRAGIIEVCQTRRDQEGRTIERCF